MEKGAEIVWETVRLWLSLGHFEEGRGFCIDMVTGPDEYSACVSNNAYTNLMAKFHLEYAVELTQTLAARFPEMTKNLREKLGLSDEEIAQWQSTAEVMYIPRDERKGIVAQDDSFLTKQVWDFATIPRDRYSLLLHYHPLVLYRHQVLKQADTVLAMVALPDRFSASEKRRIYAFYEPCTVHDSSLSSPIYSIAASGLCDIDAAYRFC